MLRWMSPRRAAYRDDAAPEQLVIQQDSVVTRHQLAELGFGRDHVRRRIGDRQWQPWGHRVVILSAAPASTVQRWRAALLSASRPRGADRTGVARFARLAPRACPHRRPGAELETAPRTFVQAKQKVAITDGVAEARGGPDAKSEADVGRIMERAGFPRPRRQVELVTTAGTRRVDLAVDLGDSRPLIVEVDGPRHDDDDARLLDAVKDAAAIADGHHVFRIPASASRQFPERLLLEFRELRERQM
jgi:hypothetical protein